jgi:hypothetical protein
MDIMKAINIEKFKEIVRIASKGTDGGKILPHDDVIRNLLDIVCTKAPEEFMLFAHENPSVLTYLSQIVNSRILKSALGIDAALKWNAEGTGGIIEELVKGSFDLGKMIPDISEQMVTSDKIAADAYMRLLDVGIIGEEAMINYFNVTLDSVE